MLAASGDRITENIQVYPRWHPMVMLVDGNQGMNGGQNRQSGGTPGTRVVETVLIEIIITLVLKCLITFKYFVHLFGIII